MKRLEAATVAAVKQRMLASIPKVDECLMWLQGKSDAPERVVKDAVRRRLADVRQRILTSDETPTEGVPAPDELVLEILAIIRRMSAPRLRRVINASGVVVHTNLGRSLLPKEAVSRLAEVATRYSNLEFDLEQGRRGSRYSLVEELLTTLTGAESALVVNNNAAAVLLALDTLAAGKEVLVSRGQLVEVGGSFRIPDIMRRSGAKLVEVGSTNRTHLCDYAGAVTAETALILKVHTSNFQIVGFTKEVGISELASLGRQNGIPVMEDLGSGCLVDLSRFGLKKEPTVQEVLAAGADLVTFSGDKMLGGPQAGIIVGRRELVERVKKNPLNRALRIDKLTLAALEVVLRLYLDHDRAMETIPTLAMLCTPLKVLQRRAARLAKKLRFMTATACLVKVLKTQSCVGGGALPDAGMDSAAVALRPLGISVNEMERRLRRQPLPVICRIEDDSLLLDVRTVADEELAMLADEVAAVLTLPADINKETQR